MKKQQGKFSELLFLYIGVLCKILPVFLNNLGLYIDPILFNALDVLGIICIGFAFLQLLYYEISKKIDDTAWKVSELDSIGIEQIFHYKYSRLEALFSQNKLLKIAINAQRLDSSLSILDSIFNGPSLKNTELHILVLGPTSDSIKQRIDNSLTRRNSSIIVRYLEKPTIDNVIVLDRGICRLCYSDYDNSLDYICVFYEYSEFGRKSKLLFEDLWNDSNAT